MIRVREFAEQVGCTPQNIYQRIKNYAKELEGHTEKGRRGILLDDFACEFLRGVMNPKEIVANDEVIEELNRLRGQLLQAGVKTTEMATKLSAVETERDRLALEVTYHQKQCLALAAHEEEQKEALERAKNEADELREELEKARQRAAELDLANRELKGRNWLERLLRKGE